MVIDEKTGVKSIESAIILDDNAVLYYRTDIPEKMRALVIIVHGVCEHSGRYDYVTGYLNREELGVLRFDLRGHGKSSGERGHVESFTRFYKDVKKIKDRAEKDFPSVPLYILGHSMGAFISSLYAVTYPGEIKGQILSGLYSTVLPLDDIKLLKKLPYNRFPKIKAKNKLGGLVSRDEKVVEEYNKDPLVLKTTTIGMSAEMFLKGPLYLGKNMTKYDLPCLLLHGGQDRIVTPESSQNFYDNIASRDKQRKVYPELYHEILNEPERDKVLQDVVVWIKDRSGI